MVGRADVALGTIDRYHVRKASLSKCSRLAGTHIISKEAMMKKPYNAANFSTNNYSIWKVATLSWIAYALGVQFKIEGIPYGAEYNCFSFGENAEYQLTPNQKKPNL